MKIMLLEHPRKISPERCNDIANTPLASCLFSGYAAGMLSSCGHQVQIIEGFLDGLTYDDIEKELEIFAPDILGVHIVYNWQDDVELYRFLAHLKKTGKISFVTVYGFYPTIAYEDIMRNCPAVDTVIVGELELTFAELVANAGNKEKLAMITGLALRNSAGEISLKPRELVPDLDSLPFPVRTEAMNRISEVNLQGSRGCYGGCTFCYINPFYGGGSHWRGRSPENIVAEIDSIIQETNIKNFYFTDPNFFGPGIRGQERALQLAELLKPRHIRFGIEARVNDIQDETIKALVEAGLCNILIGLESGRDSSLKRMNKKTTVAQNEEAIRILRKNGIEPNIGFIMFEPDASIEDIRVNFEFLKRNQLLNELSITANVLYHHQILLKGTPAFQYIQQQGRLQIQPKSAYEGVTTFSYPQVASLADLMRQITNCLFECMDGIWSGKVPEPMNADTKYAHVNHLLIEIFEHNLKELESGKHKTDQEIHLIVSQFRKEIYETVRV